jgi:hypothetical protein
VSTEGKKCKKLPMPQLSSMIKINRGEEIPAAASIIQDASPNKKTNIDSFIFSIPILL